MPAIPTMCGVCFQSRLETSSGENSRLLSIQYGAEEYILEVACVYVHVC